MFIGNFNMLYTFELFQTIYSVLPTLLKKIIVRKIIIVNIFGYWSMVGSHAFISYIFHIARNGLGFECIVMLFYYGIM